MPDQQSKLHFLPNVITSISIVSGSLAVVLAIEGEKSLIYACYLILFSAVLDFFDGFLARLFHAESEFGKHLDSLSNVISFGLAPSAVMYELLKQSERVKDHLINLPHEQVFILFTSFAIVIFSVIRLARLSTAKTLKNKVFGLPTPANAIFIASIPLIKAIVPEDFWIFTLFNIEFPISAMIGLIGLQIFVFEKTQVMIPLFIAISGLMISGFPMFSFRFTKFGYRSNSLKYNFIAYSILLILIFQSIALPLIIISYIIISFMNLLYSIIFNKRAGRAKKKFDKVFADNV